MGIFKKKGKHAPGADSSDASSTQNNKLDTDETIAIDPIASTDETVAIDPVSSADETVSIDLDAVSSDATEALNIEGSSAGDSTVVMPKPAASDTFADSAPDTVACPPNITVPNTNAFAAMSSSMPPEHKNRHGLKAFLITFFVLAAVLAAVYVGIAMMFQTQFMPNTRIDGIDLSMKSDDEVVKLLDQIPADYKIDIVGGDFSLRMTGEEVGMTIDSPGIVAAMHEEQNCWYWPWYVTKTSHDETELLKTSFNEESVDKLVEKAVKSFNKKATAPTNASITFDEESKSFVVKPEEIGTQLDVTKVQEVAKTAVAEMKEKAEVTDEQLKQPELLSTDEKIVNTVDTANGLMSSHIKLTINGQTVNEIGGDMLSDFIKISDKFEVTLDEDGMAAWVDELAGGYDTVGMQRTYTRADGKQITVSGGTYGWEIDEASLRTMILDAIKEGGDKEIEIPCVDSANQYTGFGERDWGNRYIDVDLAEQHVRFYGDDGKIIWEADCISGAPDGKHDTTQGVWYIIMKESPSKLIGYTESGKKDYETEVQYWMPFVGNAIGFHDATWQPSFGGNMYAEGYGSHGCVNLAYSDAQSLYDIIQPNDVVVVHY